MNRRKLAGSITAVVAIGAGSALLLRSPVTGSAERAGGQSVLSQSASHTEHYYADRLIYSGLGRMSAFSDVIARVKIVKASGSYRLALDPPVASSAPAPPLNSVGQEKASKAAATPQTTPSGPQPEDRGPLMTDYVVEVVDAIKGPVKPGDQLTIRATGGSDAYGQGEEEGNPLPQVGHEEIMFLNHQWLGNGKFVAVGGPQGRYAVLGDGTVQALDAESPVGQANNHKSIVAFVAAIRAAMSVSTP